MTAFARNSRNYKDSPARWQLIRERNRKSLLDQSRIGRASKRVVIILFFFDARRFETEFMQIVPSLFVGIMADDRKNWRSQIGCKRCCMYKIFCKAFATASDNFP